MPTGPVFISHSSRDAPLAHELVAALEAGGVACWISGRDVAPGANYQEVIVGAISGARGLVLLVTEAANASDEVKKEMSLASAQGIAVYPVRIGGVQPNAALRYELATREWIEGGDVPALAARLAAAIQGIATPPPGDAASPAVLALPDKPSLVVLPFLNMSGDPDQEYFADGMVEDITTALSRIGGLFVIARNSAFTYKGKPIDVKAVGRDLGVRYVVEGSVRRAGGRVRITTQLIEAASAAHLWAYRFDGPLDDIFDLQDRVTAAIAGAIEPTLRNVEIDRAFDKPTSNLDAYDLYLRATRLVEQLTANDLNLATELLRRSFTLDPRFLLGKALFSFAAGMKVALGILPRDSAELVEAIELARAVLADARNDPTTLRLAGISISYNTHEKAVARAALEGTEAE